MNKPDVASEVFETDTIVIHLVTGRYYNLAGSGGAIWTCIDQGYSEDEIANAFAPIEAASAQPIAEFFEHLLTEGLIVAHDACQPGTPQIPAEHQFSAPLLQVSCDLEELLAIDPIHNVDESGWPSRKAGLPA